MADELPARIYRFNKSEIVLEALTKTPSGEFVWSRTDEPYVFHEALELAAARLARGGIAFPLEKPEPHKEHAKQHSHPPADGPRDWLTRWQLEHDQ